MLNTRELEKIYTEYEKYRTEAKEKQDRAKELKEEIVMMMEEAGQDEVIVNGWDGLMKLELTYPEREVLNKKDLADALGIKQKDLGKPQTIIELTQAGKMSAELIEKFTIMEERMQFSAKDYKPEEE